jgi:hypothetical protein
MSNLIRTGGINYSNLSMAQQTGVDQSAENVVIGSNDDCGKKFRILHYWFRGPDGLNWKSISQDQSGDGQSSHLSPAPVIVLLPLSLTK